MTPPTSPSALPPGAGGFQNRTISSVSNSSTYFEVMEILDSSQPEFSGAMEVYAREFQGKDTGVDPRDFADELRLARNSGTHAYHLWAIRARESQAIEGMASFFTFPTGGFGGYLILAGALRGRGLLRELVSRIEDRMRRDGLGAAGWFIECDPRDGTAKIFQRCGFRMLDYPWVQPPLPAYPVDTGTALAGGARTDPSASADTEPPGPRLDLLYKAWGAREVFPLPSLGETETFLSWLRRIVYRG